MKKMLLLIVVVLVVILSGYFLYTYLNKSENNSNSVDSIPQVEKDLLLPRFNEVGLPNFTVNEEYETTVTAVVVGGNTEISIEVIGLPKGIEVSNCVRSDNSDLLQKPNSITSCLISGITTEEGEFDIKLTARSIKTGTQSTMISKLISL